jgi:hypothetical protein
VAGPIAADEPGHFLSQINAPQVATAAMWEARHINKTSLLVNGTDANF